MDGLRNVGVDAQRRIGQLPSSPNLLLDLCLLAITLFRGHAPPSNSGNRPNVVVALSGRGNCRGGEHRTTTGGRTMAVPEGRFWMRP